MTKPSRKPSTPYSRYELLATLITWAHSYVINFRPNVLFLRTNMAVSLDYPDQEIIQLNGRL